MELKLSKYYKTKLDRLVNAYYELQRTVQVIETKEYFSSVKYDKANSKSKSIESRIEKLSALKLQLIERINGIEDEYILVNNDLSEQIKKLPDPEERKALCYYFYKVPTFEKVLKNMKINKEQYYSLLLKALNNLEIVLAFNKL